MASIGKIARRTFLFGAAALAGGAAFGWYGYAKDYPNPLEEGLAEGEATFNPYLLIGSDNAITVIAPRAEMGQGISTMLATLVAEELDVTLDRIAIEHGPASHAYYNGAMLSESTPFAHFNRGLLADSVRGAMGAISRILAHQATGGSTSTIDGYEKMRRAGAMAREMLKAEAAARLGVPSATLQTADGQVRDPASGRMISYGELAMAAAKREPSPGVALRTRSEWKLLGKPQPRKDVPAKVTGAPIFGMDVRLPDMLHAFVRMNPRLGGKLESLDSSMAQGMRGVKKIVAIRSRVGEGFGVIADNGWRAHKAADAVVAEWGEAPYPAGQEEILARLAAALDAPGGFSLRNDGDPDLAFADAPLQRMIEATYSVPYLAHATMEPMNATAWFHDGELDIWAPNQSPTLQRKAAAEAAGIGEDKVRIHTTFMGGGFGRRFETDYTVFAVMLALEADGRPVKVTWSREEDMAHDYYRPAALGRYRARLDDKGLPVALTGEVATQSPIAGALGRIYPGVPMAGPDRTMIEGAFDQPYRIPNYRITGKKVDLAVPVGFWRSVGNSFNAFMHECFLDEIAAAGGLDPLDLRLELCGPYPTAAAVLERLAEISGWRNPAAPGRARGLAFTLSFGSWVGQVVEVSGTAEAVRIENVWCVADPGIALDPANLKDQMMSAIVYGLSAAMSQEITFADGRVEQSNFHDFDTMRMGQCPPVTVEILENSGQLGGGGEPGTPPAAPALANAVFALTGQRIRSLPLSGTVGFA